jgi:hypothetical protein
VKAVVTAGEEGSRLAHDEGMGAPVLAHPWPGALPVMPLVIVLVILLAVVLPSHHA